MSRRFSRVDSYLNNCLIPCLLKSCWQSEVGNNQDDSSLDLQDSLPQFATVRHLACPQNLPEYYVHLLEWNTLQLEPIYASNRKGAGKIISECLHVSHHLPRLSKHYSD